MSLLNHEGDVLRFNYRGGHGGNRNVYVYGYEGYDKDLLCYDFDRGDIRRFKRSKILNPLVVPSETREVDLTVLPAKAVAPVVQAFKDDGFNVIVHDETAIAVKFKTPKFMTVGSGDVYVEGPKHRLQVKIHSGNVLVSYPGFGTMRKVTPEKLYELLGNCLEGR